ncbi:hypothetical protein [Frigoribacterium sp. Leaf172]|uniref:hypothetical protein n=1 Tax=Frigoribacterium sp. Leaf172 TaxID=1736285 RepID=UPI000A4DEB8D|nr:hypothetical protein [Frigoribacterium sp. Leaf172]
MLTDAEIVAAMRRAERKSRPLGTDVSYLDYEMRDIRASPGHVDVELIQRDGHSARLLIALPSTGEPQYWLYFLPDTAEEWVEQLLLWLDEQVFTSGLMDERVRVERNGASYVQSAPYGWRLTDPAEHARLAEAAGPDGWYG